MKQWIVDAFTDQPFKGNSAAVILVEEFPAESWMQNVAIENNLSETAYVKKIEPQHYAIRWFSPMTEVDFCGHATLASAHILFNEFGVKGKLTFSTLHVGELQVEKLENGRIQMSFPARPPVMLSSVPEQIYQGLSIKPRQVLRSPQAYFAIYDNAQQVKELGTDNELLKQLAPYDVVATAKSDKTECDFVSRYFWPANGGDEDPVTGSIHAGLTPYWAEQLDKSELIANQISTRGGILYCRMADERVLVSGDAVVFSECEIKI
jgi:PhzF family phenazine biosynthesis protein